jgi:hypothetical protein
LELLVGERLSEWAQVSLTPPFPMVGGRAHHELLAGAAPSL